MCRKSAKIMGVLRDTFYRYRELAYEGGVEALITHHCRSWKRAMTHIGLNHGKIA